MIIQKNKNLVELHCFYCGVPLQITEEDFPKTATVRDVIYNEKNIKVKCPKCGCKFYINTCYVINWNTAPLGCCEYCDDATGTGCVNGGCYKVQK
jgi:hypothetical protein